MPNFIYRGYTYTICEPGQFPVRVYEGTIEIYACRNEDEAMVFIDRTKRELAAAKVKSS